MSESRFKNVKEILDRSVGGPNAPVNAPHRDFWRGMTRDDFIAYSFLGFDLITLHDGPGSILVKSLRGESPFGADIGTAGAFLNRMPSGRPSVPGEDIDFISAWIGDGCPDDSPEVDILVTLNGAGTGDGFLVSSRGEAVFPGRLILKSLNEATPEVTLRVAGENPVGLEFDSSSFLLTEEPVEVEVHATSASAARNDTTIEILANGEMAASYGLTVISSPKLRFGGRFQCRLATDPDGYDHPWGENSSFGLYAVQGPDPNDPDEPPLDRIVRFHDAVAVRPYCRPVGVFVTAVAGAVGGQDFTFETGDPVIGQPVKLGPDCKFDARDGAFAVPGWEPISDFQISIGDMFYGESEEGRPRAINDPPSSTAPYADGVYRMEMVSDLSPRDFGYPESTWPDHASALVTEKLARLLDQQATQPAEARIRQRRILEHQRNQSGMTFTATMVERYTGTIHRNLNIVATESPVLGYLSEFEAFTFYAEFLDFDSDCQCGTVWGRISEKA